MKSSYIAIFIMIILGACGKDGSVDDVRLSSGIKRVWAVDDGEKIKKEDIENPLATDQSNTVWKDSTVNIFGARNEIIAFQLILQAEKDGAKGVDIHISDLKNGSAMIPGSDTGSEDPFDYRGRFIELFTESYLHITTRTPADWWFYSASAMPSAYYTGWVPDCLIPFSAPAGKGGAPFSIQGNSNQGVWVDILIPKEADAGTYTGTITLTISGKTWAEIPLNLKVCNFTLPDSTHLRNMFGFYAGEVARRHGVYSGTSAYFDLETRYHQMAHRHRFDLVRHVYSLSDMDHYHYKYLTGELYRQNEGYAGPGENIGNTTFSIGYGGSFPEEYGGSVESMNQADWQSGSDKWADWFSINAPGVEIHKYLFPDEPDWKGPAGALGTGSMDTIRMQAEWTHSNPGSGRNIPSLVTNRIRSDLKGYVDFWSMSAQNAVEDTQPSDIETERAAGHKFGVYNGWRPGMGAVVIDADAVEFRVMPWIAWKYKLDQYFYWCTNFWQDIDVYSDPLTYADAINGDGTFLYPGQDHVFPASDRGLAGPLSSIRAKNWRRGEQDYEYLWLAKASGLGDISATIVDACVPSALWEAKGHSNISWSSRGHVFEQYRRQLAELIESGAPAR